MAKDNNNTSSNTPSQSNDTSGAGTMNTPTTQFPRVISEREMTKGLDPEIVKKNDSHFAH